MSNLPKEVIHTATAVVLSAYTYTQIFASADTTLLINGSTVTVPKAVVIDIKIKSIGASTDVFCLGTPYNVGGGQTYVGR